MARYSKRTSKATKRALGTRGGFKAYIPLNRYVAMEANAFVGKYIKDMAMGYAKSKVDPARMGVKAGAFVERKLSQLKDTRVSVDIEGTSYQKITNNDFVVSGETQADTVSTMRTTVVKNKNNAIRIGRVHTTKFHTGKPTSSTIKRVGKNNGVNMKTDYDTSVSLTTGQQRKNLTTEWGFNQKGYAAYNTNSYWSLQDIATYFNLAANVDTNILVDQKAYAHVHELDTEYLINNTNSYLDTVVKIHWCTVEQPNVNPFNAFYECFFVDPQVPGGDQMGRYPTTRQLGNASTGNGRTYVTVDPYRGNLNSSERFENVFTIQKTMTKTLSPGDVWKIKHKHSCGSGIRLDLLRDFIDPGNLIHNGAAPISLYPIFELKGKLVDCVAVNDKALRYTGTAPGGVQFEFKKVAKIGMASNPVWWEPSTGGFEVENYGVSIYSAADPSINQIDNTTKVFNVPVSNLSADGTGAGKYFIPVTTDTTVKNATTSGT